MPRRYGLSSKGLRALRAAIKRHRPWERSTGPRTRRGKIRSAKNSFKLGLRSSKELEMARLDKTLTHLLIDGSC